MITPNPPKVHPDGRYSIADTCKILTICRSSLRKYANGGGIPYHYFSNGQKFFLGSDILKFWHSTAIYSDISQ